MVVIPPPSPTSPTTKTRTISDLHRGSESEALLSPPPYATREAATSPPEAVKPPREPASRRFLSALYAAVVIYFVLSLVWAAIVGLIKYKAEKRAHPSIPGQNEGKGNDSTVISCQSHWKSEPISSVHARWSDHSTAADAGQWFDDESRMVDATWTEQDRSTASIDLPVGRRLFFVSSGVLAKGLIRFVPASPRLRSSAQEARVDLSASFSSAEARRAVDWCMLKRRDGEYGVGIYTPENWPSVPEKNAIHFHVTVTLPRAHDGPLDLETDIPSFEEEFGKIPATLSLDTVSVQGSDVAIRAESLSARSIRITTSNAPIRGFFNVTEELKLVTSNAPIITGIYAYSPSFDAITTVDLTTSNAAIEAEMSLLSPSSPPHSHLPSSPSAFKITSTTSNGPLHNTFLTAPIDAHLSYTGFTTNNQARLVLPSAFEGTIEAGTSGSSGGGIVIDDAKPSRDPKGLGRKRRCSMIWGDFGSSVMRLKTWWGDESDKEREMGGVAKVETSNGLVQVTLL